MNVNALHDNYFSAHGAKRTQQRGVKKSCANMLIRLADKEVPVRNGHVSLSVTKSKLKRLMLDKELNAQTAEKLQNLVVIARIDSDKLIIVTVLHVKRDVRGRHYRKHMKIRYNRSKRQIKGAW